MNEEEYPSKADIKGSVILTTEEQEEDYWNTSEIQSFDFGDFSKNDNILSLSSKETTKLLREVKKENDQSTISSIASSGSVTSFEELNISKEPKEFKIIINPAQAIRELVNGEKVVLEVFTSLQLKKDLLKSAIESHDTDVIFRILYFLKKTLNEYILRKLLTEFISSANVYINLLLFNSETNSAVDFLSMLAQFEDAAIIGYQDILKKKIVPEKIRLLKQLACSSNHLKISEFFNLHADLLEKQRSIRSLYLDTSSKSKCRYLDEGIPMDQFSFSRFHIPCITDLVGSPVVSTLRYLAKHDCKAVESSCAPLLKKFDVPKTMYVWSLVCGRSSVGAFSDVRNAVTVKSMFGPPRLCISVEPLRTMMQHFGATTEQMEQVLKMDRTERAEPVDTQIVDKGKRHHKQPRQDEIERVDESPFHSNILMQLSGGTEIPVNCKDHPDDTVPKVLAGRRSFDYEFGSQNKSRQTWCSANKKIMLWILLIFVFCVLLGSSIWAFITFYPYFYGVSDSVYFNGTLITNAAEHTSESTEETIRTYLPTFNRTNIDFTTSNIHKIMGRPVPTAPYLPEVPRIMQEVNIFATAKDESANIESQSRIRKEFGLGCEFQCRDGSGCFPSSFRCDNAVQCIDASDERECSCPDRLEPWKLCDGFPDCPDREDELGCYGCSKNQFSCAPSLGKGCYNTTQRCDGTSQCLASVDETDCIRLDSVYDNTDFAVIERNMNGRWYPVCIDREADSFDFGEALNTYASLICKTYNGEEAQMSAVRAYYPSAPFNVSRSFVLKITGNRLRGIRLQQNSCQRLLAIKCSPRSCATVESSDPPQLAQFDQNGMLPSVEKIVGGRPAMIRDWPWIVAVFRNGTHICGGVILNSRWILTAAHCFNRHFNYFYEVQAGMIRRLSLSPYEQTRFITHIIQEKGYSPTNLKNDIALAYVEPPLKLNKFAAPICLAEEDFKVEAGTLCNVAGWGSVNETGYLENIGQADLLQEVSIPIVSLCKNSYNDPDKEICAGAEGKDSCQGDSGSPLLCPAPHSGNMLRMVGLVSHGKGCARETSPGVYTKVASYRQWIDSIISKDFNSIKYSKQIKTLKINKCPGMTCKMSSGSCLHPNYICDKQVDCFDGSDELNCTRKEELDSKGKSLVIVTPARRHRGTCPEGYRECLSIKECIPSTAWCDRHLDCIDKSDENECTCGHYIWRLNPHRFCDGIVDCADFSDETGCDFNCKSPSYFCPLSRQCLSNVTICNRRQECPLGEDELFCLALSKEAENRELQIKLDEFGFPIRNNKGFVSINTKSVWEQLCAFDLPTQKLRNATCQYLGFGFPVETNLSQTLKEQLTPVLPLRGLVYSGSKYTKKSRGNFDPKKVAFQQIERRIDEGKGDIVLQGKSQNISDTICGNLYLECSSQPLGIRPLYNSNRGLLQPQRYSFLGRGLWPWHLLLLNKGQFICDATLVDFKLAVVGIGCISKIRQPIDLTIAGGLIRNTLFSTPFEQIRMVTKIWFFEHFVLLEASVPFEPTMDINSLKLQPRYAGLPNNISRCFITRMVSNIESYLLKFDKNSCKDTSQPFCFFVKQPDLTAMCRTPLQGGAVVCSEDSREWYLAGIYETNENICYENGHILRASPSVEVASAIYSIQKGNAKGDPLLTQVCQTHRCIDGKCLALGEICDGKSDCRDASDEPTECKYYKYCAYKDRTCSCDDKEFVCGDGRCITPEKVCDEVQDCSRGDDEKYSVCSNCTALVLYKGDKIACQSQLCKNQSICSCGDQFNCHKSERKECISKLNVCDGAMDCLNGEDEDFCVGISSDKTERGGLLEPSGYLMVQIKGSWYTYCDETLSNTTNIYCEVILGSKLNEVRHFEFEQEESCTTGLAKINCAM